jgi:pyruvate formate lyase activating enzyme
MSHSNPNPVKGKGPSFPKGTILRIQRMSTEDGPGIRSTVFFKGCPLHCLWCHNPESISPRPEVHWVKNRCIGCLACVAACPEGCLSAESGLGITVDRTRCTGCLSCCDACPSTAMEPYGRVCTVDEIVREVIKDRVYYEKSGGGVTLSGGEPTCQDVYAKALLKELKEQGIHTALDTCGQCQWDTLEGLLPYADLVLFDIKGIAPEPHREHTGATSTLILENVLRLAEYMEKFHAPKELWIRTPVIPGLTSDPAVVRAIGTFIREKLFERVSRWDLCAFNNLCTHKYEELGRDWALKDLSLVTEEEMEKLQSVGTRVLEMPGMVHAGGPMRKADATEGRKRLSLIDGGRR